eukprot:TRINITY_DN7342_c0_g1_i1.p1 TRINITY_DN7342_c0_g1~~TRINITY_DN7342_c0_g1_i1.p1  ORF type:complete len:390 (+),score=66.15 TRINITY_DN7342_c0_g1_i1:52-1170(+)
MPFLVDGKPYEGDEDPSKFFEDGMAAVKNEDDELIPLDTTEDLEMLVDCYGEEETFSLIKVPFRVCRRGGKSGGGLSLKVMDTYSIHGSKAVYGVTLSTDGTKIVSVGRDKKAFLHDIVDNKQVGHHTGKDFLLTVSYSPTSEKFLIGSSHPTMRLFDSSKGVKEISSYKMHSGKVYSAHFLPNGKQFATASMDGTSVVVDASTKAVLAKYTSPNKVSIFSANVVNPNVIVCAADHIPHTIDFYDVRTSKPAFSPIPGHHTSTIWSLAASSNNELLSTGMDGNVILYDLRMCTKVTHFKTSVAMHHATFAGNNDEYIVTCGRNSEVSIFDTALANKLAFHNFNSTVYCVSCVDRQIACCTLSGNVNRVLLSW